MQYLFIRSYCSNPIAYVEEHSKMHVKLIVNFQKYICHVRYNVYDATKNNIIIEIVRKGAKPKLYIFVSFICTIEIKSSLEIAAEVDSKMRNRKQ